MHALILANIVTSREVHADEIQFDLCENSSFDYYLKFNFDFIFHFFYSIYSNFPIGSSLNQ